MVINERLEVFTAPELPMSKPGFTKIFLAGTIDLGNSDNWQSDFIERIKQISIKTTTDRFIIYNPRREKFNSNEPQKFENPIINQQIGWELDRMDHSDVIVMNILKDSKSPITLMELGLYAKSGKLLVVCEDGYYRQGNVDFMCSRYNIPLYRSIGDIRIGDIRNISDRSK